MFRKAGITEANSAFNMWSDARFPAAAPTLADFLNWMPSTEPQVNRRRRRRMFILWISKMATVMLMTDLLEAHIYIKLAEAVSMRCEEKLRGRSEYPVTNTDMVHPP